MSKHTARGYTFLHLLSAIGIAALMLMAISRTHAATSSLNLEARLRLRANEDLRRNLEALTNVLRAADFDTLGGLDANGVATAPTFASVLGADHLGQQLGPTESIAWRRDPQPVAGGIVGGALYHTVNGQSRLIAARVPQNGFRVVLVDGVLRIECRTFYVVQNRSIVVDGTTAILPRN